MSAKTDPHLGRGASSFGFRAMSSTYLSLRYHIVFSTKNRKPLIDCVWQSRLHEYLGGTINGLGGYSACVGGVTDHVHLLFGLKATHCLADFMRELKKRTSSWIREEMKMSNFSWQEGYAAFSVSPTSCENVQKYILGQEEHHRKRTFREELVALLVRAGIKFDEKFLD